MPRCGRTMFLYWKKRGAYELGALPPTLAGMEYGAVERFSWSSSLDISEQLAGTSRGWRAMAWRKPCTATEGPLCAGRLRRGWEQRCCGAAGEHPESCLPRALQPARRMWGPSVCVCVCV